MRTKRKSTHYPATREKEYPTYHSNIYQHLVDYQHYYMNETTDNVGGATAIMIHSKHPCTPFLVEEGAYRAAGSAGVSLPQHAYMT